MILGFEAGGPRGYNNISISNNQFTGYQHGFWFSGAQPGTLNGLFVDSNKIAGSIEYGIFVGGANGESPANLQITNNIVTGPATSRDSSFGIYLNRLQNILVSGNKISNFGMGGIQFLGISSSNVTANEIVNNGKPYAGSGIQLGQWNTLMGSTYNTISYNRLYDNQVVPTQVFPIQIVGTVQKANQLLSNSTTAN
jgi:Right handed beta helix region